MLSVESPASRGILIVVLIALVVTLAIRALSKSRTEFQRFARFERTRNRQRMMRHWLLRSLAVLGGSAVVVLLLAWQFIPLQLRAVDRWPVAVWFRSLVEATGALIPTVAIVVAVLLVVGTVLAVASVRDVSEVPTIGDIASLLPRNRAELVLGALLSVNAGIVEELLFRLALPALLFGVTGNAVAAVGGSILLFALLHVYQGWPGIVGALVIGILLMTLYLATGSILAAMIAHALIDLRSLVLIPMVVYRVHRTR